jgi:hypothetical protein
MKYFFVVKKFGVLGGLKPLFGPFEPAVLDVNI